jgi:hypothetical protein
VLLLPLFLTFTSSITIDPCTSLLPLQGLFTDHLLFNNSCDVIINNAIFENIISDTIGGAIFFNFSSQSFSILSTTFTECNSPKGGALACQSSKLQTNENSQMRMVALALDLTKEMLRYRGSSKLVKVVIDAQPLNALAFALPINFLHL